MLRLLAVALSALAAPVPAWIARAVPPPIVAWREADVLGTSIPEGIAVSSAGGSYFVGIADSRLDPPEMVLDYDLVHRFRGSHVQTLLAGRILGGSQAAIAVDIFVTPSIGEEAWVLSVAGGRFHLLKTFAADHIRISGRTVELTWTSAARSPVGKKRQAWHYERGAYRPAG